MRIAFFADNFYPELSGITDTIITTSKRLKSRGHDIIYVGPYYSPADYALATRQFPATPNEDMIDGMPIYRLPSLPMPLSPTGQSRFTFPWGDTLDKVAAFKPDIIHTNSPYGVGLAAAKMARRLHVPLVGTNHTAIEDFFPPLTRAVMRRWDARYYNRCDFMSAPYEGLIVRMREIGFNKPGHAVPNPADLHEFSKPSAEEKTEHKRALGLEGPVLLYTGRLGVEKRVDVLVRATAILVKEFPTLTFIATGHGAARAGLDNLVQKLGIGHRVRFTGYLSRQALPHIYQAADMFWMASTSDSQSLALMQGYASGLAAVCARARGLPDYTPERCGFLATPGKSQEFAARAGEILGNQALRERMSAAAIDYVQQFAPDKIARLWEDIYRETIEEKK